MIDFNSGTELLNKFWGSEKKTTLLYNGEVYMLKFPDPIREKSNSLSYMNNQFSEHIGCLIFKSCGFLAQETVIGSYTDKTGKERIVVGCKDFTQDGATLHEFSKLGNSLVTVDTKLSATIENIILIINETDLITDKAAILGRFWDMFVVDALIGNYDRHFDNWGLLSRNETVTFAPIYDCGSSLGAILSDDRMRVLMANPAQFKNEEYNVRSCYSISGKRIFYHSIFSNPPAELSDAIARIVPRIDMPQIVHIISNTEGISDTRKSYLIRSVTMRYEQILTPSLKRVIRHGTKGATVPSERQSIKERMENARIKAEQYNNERSSQATKRDSLDR